MNNGLTATEEFKRQYNDLVLEVFGFSFEKWFELNVWDENYEVYSIFQEERIISNVGVYKMKMIVNGIDKEFIQIGAVATRIEDRGKGLSRKIMEHIFKIYPNTPAWLWANDSVLNFYPKFDFVPTSEKQPYIKVNLQRNNKSLIRMEITDSKINDYLKNKKRFSNVLDCKNHFAINWFHLINIHHKDIYEIPELDLMLVIKQMERTLMIYDIIGEKPVDFSEILTHLSFEGVDTIKFGFNPEWLDLECSFEDVKVENSTLFVRGGIDLDKNYIIPRLIRT